MQFKTILIDMIWSLSFFFADALNLISQCEERWPLLRIVGPAPHHQAENPCRTVRWDRQSPVVLKDIDQMHWDEGTLNVNSNLLHVKFLGVLAVLTEREKFMKDHSKTPDIRLVGEFELIDWLRSIPKNWAFSWVCDSVILLVKRNDLGQPKISYFHQFFMCHQDVPGSQISVHKAHALQVLQSFTDLRRKE